MPHRCQDCENIIPDEADSLLEGCPECGNQKWEYIEESEDEDKTQKEARTEFIDKDELPTDGSAIDALQNPTGDTDSDSNSLETGVKRVKDVETIRDNLNRQYEGIKVVENGKYEINLTELYRGNSYVIEVGEDGAYEVRKSTK
jgi:predicted  nucleic acid-binding Zn-ribbon protein